MSTVLEQFQLTRSASSSLAMASGETRNAVLSDIATLIHEKSADILRENQKDLDQLAIDHPMRDRLKLTQERLSDLAESVISVMQLPDPAGQVLSKKTLPNGLELSKITVPLGVVGVIFESRPNVTIDVAALCIRSGNAAVLRGGSDAIHTNTILVHLIHQALVQNGISTDVVYLMPTDRELVTALLTAVKFIDVIIPRGSEALIQRVRKESLVPTIETGAGVCHTYVAANAEISMAVDIVVNAKVSRPAVCNSLDTIVLHKSIASAFLTQLVAPFTSYKVKVYADNTSHPLLKSLNYPFLEVAKEADFGREFLDFACSIKVVDDFQEALSHISTYSSRHSEAIVTSDEVEANYFLSAVDAAAVYWNASTRFTDGGEFGLGAEIGISTQKLHARGPFALEKLVTEKWIGIGQGQIR
ncbi:glutamate-5-semialdehyde dehydrogenase [Aquirufa sp. HETE-83D]|uniref:Gamma-glutamyl phosphate reductase n=1 Tax=Aquirufa esocilacus TaxID=3096513 RepID=A0ABW6DHH0_9BACT